jgi:phospholipid-translocating ATPase
LCFAYREIDVEEYERWAQQYHEATLALVDRERRLEEVAEVIERDMQLLGASGIEDKLQEVCSSEAKP